LPITGTVQGRIYRSGDGSDRP